MMPSTATYKCANCGDPFIARTADRKRGWARFCSKSCKASKQEKRTGQFRALLNRDSDEENVGHIFDSGYFGHGQN
jgi:hypothetical protein